MASFGSFLSLKFEAALPLCECKEKSMGWWGISLCYHQNGQALEYKGLGKFVKLSVGVR